MVGHAPRHPKNTQVTRTLRALLALVLLAAIFSGCSDEGTRNQIDKTADVARDNLKQANQMKPAKHYNPLVVTDKIWTGNMALRMQRGMPLPPKYEGVHGITLVSNSPLSLADIADVISAQTGIPVRLGAGTAGGGSHMGAGSAAPNLGMPGAMSPSPVMP